MEWIHHPALHGYNVLKSEVEEAAFLSDDDAAAVDAVKAAASLDFFFMTSVRWHGKSKTIQAADLLM